MVDILFCQGNDLLYMYNADISSCSAKFTMQSVLAIYATYSKEWQAVFCEARCNYIFQFTFWYQITMTCRLHKRNYFLPTHYKYGFGSVDRQPFWLPLFIPLKSLLSWWAVKGWELTQIQPFSFARFPGTHTFICLSVFFVGNVHMFIIFLGAKVC